MIFRTTSRSWATGARTSRTTGRPVAQYWRSPRKIFRTSARERFVTGVSAWTTMATSDPREVCAASGARYVHNVHRRKAAARTKYFLIRLLIFTAPSERKAGLEEQSIDVRLTSTTLGVAVFAFEGGKVGDVPAQSQRGPSQVGDAEDRFALGDMNIFIAIVGLPVLVLKR